MTLRLPLLKTLMTGAALVVGLGGIAQAEDKTKVGFVYVGPVGDFGWSYEHNEGRKAVEEAFGDKVETMYVESVPEGVLHNPRIFAFDVHPAALHEPRAPCFTHNPPRANLYSQMRKRERERRERVCE